jgi:hypothetical protein
MKIKSYKKLSLSLIIMAIIFIGIKFFLLPIFGNGMSIKERKLATIYYDVGLFSNILSEYISDYHDIPKNPEELLSFAKKQDFSKFINYDLKIRAKSIFGKPIKIIRIYELPGERDKYLKYNIDSPTIAYYLKRNKNIIGFTILAADLDGKFFISNNKLLSRSIEITLQD